LRGRGARPAKRCENCSEFGRVVLGFADHAETSHIEFTIERAGPERATVCCAARRSRL